MNTTETGKPVAIDNQPAQGDVPAGTMSLRDFFAGHAMAALIKKVPLHDRQGEHGVHMPTVDEIHQVRRDIAQSAYDYADAMLGERSIVRVLLVIALLLTSSAICQAQDVILRKADGQEVAYSSDDRSEAALFKLTEFVCESKSDGDRVTLFANATGGKFDQLDLSKLSRFTVAPGVALTMTKHHDPKTYPDGTSPKGPSVILGEKPITISGHIRQRTWNPHEDGALIGWTDGVTKGDVTFQDAKLNGAKDCDYVLYTWVSNSKYKFSVKLLDSEMLYARQGIALNANQSEFDVLCKGSKFIGDATGGHSIASTSTIAIDCVLGNVVRGKGKWHIEDCTSKLTGLPSNYTLKNGVIVERPDAAYGVPRLSAFGNQYDSSSKANKALLVTAKNVRCEVVDPGNAKEWYDYDFRYEVPFTAPDNTEREDKAKQAGDKLLAEARGGSGEDGSVKVWVAK